MNLGCEQSQLFNIHALLLVHTTKALKWMACTYATGAFIDVYVYTYTCPCTRVRARIDVYVHTYTCTCTRVRARKHIHAFKDIPIHANTHTLTPKKGPQKKRDSGPLKAIQKESMDVMPVRDRCVSLASG